MQLWLPVFFITAFCLCYILAFHSPKIQDVPVAVVNSPATSAVTQKIETNAPNMFSFRYFGDENSAVDSVRKGDTAGALIVPASGQGQPEVVIATAHQFQAANVVESSFQQIFATAQGVRINNIVQLPSSDSFGQGAMYMMLSWCIGGYMVAMFIGMMGVPLSHSTRIGVLTGGAIMLALLANVITGLILGVYKTQYFTQMTGLAILWIFTIGLFVNGISYFFGRFIAGPALLLFVFLSMPASGAAFPAWMVPSFFSHLQPYVVGHGITEMIKRLLYGVGEPYWQGFVLMAAYAIVGVLTMIVGKRWRESKEIDRILNGKTTMMAEAQGAMLRHGMENRAKTLLRHGIDPETGDRLYRSDIDEDKGSNGDGSHADSSAAADVVAELENSVHGDMMTNTGRSLGLGDVDREYDIRHPAVPGRHEDD
ncbi:ABC transporter permease [Nocardia sp. CA2R105]|uniref:ABC transporter permease n=1 Tax=Nocardia coffeae TaxID=2873381 RepID=UPI001CA6F8CC|nr:ABC transporter permease [Nocardia coffeae]MBY8863565.1 ABC transporter permease [Nocardia coffeae]